MKTRNFEFKTMLMRDLVNNLFNMSYFYTFLKYNEFNQMQLFLISSLLHTYMYIATFDQNLFFKLKIKKF